MSTEPSMPERMPPWQRLGEFDGFVIEGVEYRRQSSDKRGQLLYETSRPSVTASYSHHRWEEIRKAPGFRHIRGQHDPHRVEIRASVGVDFASDLPPQQFMWMQYVESLILDLEVRYRNGTVKLVEEDVRPLIDGEMGREARRRLKERQLGRTSAGAQAYVSFDITASVLLKKRRAYLKKGIMVLRDQRYKSGRSNHLQPDVSAMLAVLINEANGNPSANPTSILDDLRDEIEEINEDRSRKALAAEDGTAVEALELLRLPDIKTVRKRWNGRDKFSADIARFGLEVAVKLNPAVRGTPDKLGPLDRIEYDESIVDAIVFLTETGIWSYLTAKEKKGIRKGRLVIGVAICTVTRVIVGMRIYEEGNGEETVETFKMILEDKTRYIPPWLRDQITWHQHGGIAQVVMDQGSNNISQVARTVLANLDVSVTYARAGNPAERGVGERIFRTFAHRIYSLLDARTGSNVVDRRNYRPEDRASLTMDELWQVMVVGVAGIYHNSPHSELNGRTPAGEWDRLVPDYGVNALPDPNRRRVTLGKHRFKTATRYGVASFGLSYVHPLIDHHYLHGHGDLEVAGDPDDIGAVSFRYGDQWHEAPCVDPDMRGVRWIDWFNACQPQRDLASEDAQKRRAARRAAKRAIRSIQQNARNRQDLHPPVVNQEEITKGERAVFGKYEHAEDDLPFENGQLGMEVIPDNDELHDGQGTSAPSPAVPAVKKSSGKSKPNWTIKP